MVFEKAALNGMKRRWLAVVARRRPHGSPMTAFPHPILDDLVPLLRAYRSMAVKRFHFPIGHLKRLWFSIQLFLSTGLNKFTHEQ